MKFGAVSTADAAGAILAHSVAVDRRRIAKGHVLDAGDVSAAIAAGIETLTVARLDPGDVGEDVAAGAIAEAVAGEGLCAAAPVHGRANLTAAEAGLLRVEAAAVAALNRTAEAITLGTLPDHSRVGPGDTVATVKIITFAVPDDVLAGVLDGAAAMLALARFRPMRALLIQTVLPGTAAKLLAKTAAVTEARLHALGGTMAGETRCPHQEAALAEQLRHAPDADLILIAGASATTDRRDVVPAAIERAGGRIERLGMPVDPGNLLCLGGLRGRPVIGLPGCARSPKRNGFDWVLERIFAGLEVASADIAGMGAGGLLAEVERPEPRAAPRRPAARAGVVVLAGGSSVRMGGENKLLAELGGRAVLVHTLDAIEAAGLGPPVVVTGHRRDAVERLVAGRDVTTVHAADHAGGLSRSLAAGIDAVPADWDAAIVALGDMPEVGAEDFRALARAATADGIAIASHAGKRGNPVAWGRRFFARLGALAGDVGGKALLAEFSSELTEVACGAGVLSDVDTPEALAAARQSYVSTKSSAD